MTDFAYSYRLDGKIKLDNGVYSDPDTTFTMPFEDETLDTAILGPAFGGNFGDVLSCSVSGTTITIAGGDYSAGTVLFGRSYRMEAELSRQYGRDGRGEATMFDARVDTRRVIAMHNDSGPFSLITEKTNRATRTKTSTVPSGSDVATGRLEAWHNGLEEDLTRKVRSDSIYPVNVSSVEYVVDFEPRSA